jgi:hypothetical protein
MRVIFFAAVGILVSSSLYAQEFSGSESGSGGGAGATRSESLGLSTNAPETSPRVIPGEDEISPSGSIAGRQSPIVIERSTGRLVDDPRYRQYQGRHWYYLPDKTWRVWTGETWAPYSPGMFAPKATVYRPQTRAYRYSGRGYNSGVYGQSITRSMNPGEYASPQPDPNWGPNIPESGYLSDTPTGYGHVVPGMNAPYAQTPLPNKAELKRAQAKAAAGNRESMREPTGP